jgi:DNA-binding XRE family transcriptional regulator
MVGVSGATISLFESNRRHPPEEVADAIRAALEAAGVIFVIENGEGSGVRLIGKMNTGEQVARGRRILGWSHADLAAEASLSETTARNSENGKRRITPSSLAAIRASLEAAGIVFHEDGVSVTLRDTK